MVITYSVDRAAAENLQTPIPNSFILEYIQEAPAVCLRVYLYAQMQYGCLAFADDDIASALNIEEQEVVEAFEYWQRKGLVSILRDSPLHVEFRRNSSSYTKPSQGKYNRLLEALRPILGTRILSATELKTVYDWIEVFGLSEDAVEALFMYCINTKGARVSIRYIDEVAKSWADNSILTADDAKEYIASNTVYHKGAYEVLMRLGKKRRPTEDEVALYRKWVSEYKLSLEVIDSACEAMLGAANPSFLYLSRIIDSYVENGTINTDALLRYNKQQAELEDFSRGLFKKMGLKTMPSVEQRDKISTWLSDYHMTRDMLMLLAEHARDMARPFDFMCKRVARWNNSDIHNYDAAKQDLTLPDKKQYAKPETAGSFKQRTYTKAELDSLAAHLDDEEDE